MEAQPQSLSAGKLPDISGRTQAAGVIWPKYEPTPRACQDNGQSLTSGVRSSTNFASHLCPDYVPRVAYLGATAWALPSGRAYARQSSEDQLQRAQGGSMDSGRTNMGTNNGFDGVLTLAFLIALLLTS